jgi:hypothetical protein
MTHTKDEALDLAQMLDALIQKYSDQLYDGKGAKAANDFELDVVTLKQTIEFLSTTPPAAQPAPVQEPVGCEGAIVNGRVYADRLEHDYRFECEAGPLHLCNDWVEFRRCFEWLAQHTTPPEAQRQWVGLTDEEIQAEWLLTPQHDKAEGVWFGRRLEAKLKEKNT